MGKFIAVICILAILFAFFTNPSKASYVDWSREQVKNAIISGANDGYGNAAGWLVGGVIGIADSIIDKMIENATEVNDYILFTVFTTNLFEETRVIGIFNRFFPLDKDLFLTGIMKSLEERFG